MAIVKCPKCKAVILDTTEDKKEKVHCAGCGRWYEVDVKDGQIKRVNEVAE